MQFYHLTPDTETWISSLRQVHNLKMWLMPTRHHLGGSWKNGANTKQACHDVGSSHVLGGHRSFLTWTSMQSSLGGLCLQPTIGTHNQFFTSKKYHDANWCEHDDWTQMMCEIVPACRTVSYAWLQRSYCINIVYFQHLLMDEANKSRRPARDPISDNDSWFKTI